MYADTKPSKAAIKAYEQNDSYAPSTKAKYKKADVYPFYECERGWDVERGEWIIEYVVAAEETAYCNGIWRIRSAKDWRALLPSKDEIIFADVDDTACGLHFPMREQKELGRRLTDYYKSQKKVPEMGASSTCDYLSCRTSLN
jgi:hypothetical protein